MPKKVTLSTIKERLHKIYGYNQYDYSLLTEETFKGTHYKVPIRCIKHDVVFEMATHVHEQNHGCKICFLERLKIIQSLTIEEFITRASEIHNNKYSYKNFIYSGVDNKSLITCPIHGDFLQNPNDHLYCENGCPPCGQETTVNGVKLDHQEFVERLKNIFGNEYQPIDEYDGMFKKIKLKHLICNEIFSKTPDTMLNQQQGCTNCKEPHGERKIRLFLIDNNIKYERQKTFKDCLGIGKRRLPLRFDFCVYDINDNIICLIEYDGPDHFPPMEKQARTNPKRYNDKNFKYNQIKDNIKNSYCENKNIKLLRIDYHDEKRIDDILTSFLNVLLTKDV